ncbi:MAG: UvrD-helicase domain-containing protein [Proteobacteria bacterium]|nr:UvrD-helicase domain-containing protein [Pseudomonadota bacterium]
MAFSLDTLNPPQRDAVTYSGDAHCLILAGAGSGKTRVLTHRIAWLIGQGVDPSTILAITFTNKAAAEMRERALALVSEHAEGLKLSTFHAFGARFLRHFATYAQLEPSFTIYGESEQKSLIKKVMTEMGLIGGQTSELLESESKKSNTVVNEYMYTIMGWKEAGMSVETAHSEAKSRESQNMANVYEMYEKQLLVNNAVDFAGLLLWPLYILRYYENVRARIQAKYRHILVDEFQDTNSVQLDLLGLLCGPSTQLTVVGDDDQSIYTWRGADPTAILEFSQRFGACEVFKLEQNYRSTQPILTCAGNLIACNEKRAEKRLWTSQEGGEKVHVISYASDWDEAADVISQVIARHRNMRIPWQNIAVLYRKNSQSVSFERECSHNAVPYQVLGGTGFYEREEIVDLMAYLRVMVNPADMVAFRRIINKPARGIGEKTCDKLVELVRKKADFGKNPAESLLGLLADVVEGRCKIPRAGAKLVTGCQQLLALFERCEDWRNRSPRETLLDILDETHFYDHLKKVTAKKGQEYDDAQERIQSLIQELDAHQAKSPNDLPGFLEDMSLIRPEADETRHAVNLMTIHSAKGLEFDLVYIVGAADGILPLERGGTCDIEEERRLMYVAMTRAKNVLTITYPQMSHEYGRQMVQTPSRFLDEMVRKGEESAIDRTEHGMAAQYNSPMPKLAWSHTPEREKPKENRGYFEDAGESLLSRAKKRAQVQNDFVADPIYEEECIDIHASDKDEPACVSPQIADIANDSAMATSKNGRPIAVGTKVNHKVHGRGVVVQLEKSGNDYKAMVAFRKAGIRTIIARFLEVF